VTDLKTKVILARLLDAIYRKDTLQDGFYDWDQAGWKPFRSEIKELLEEVEKWMQEKDQ